MFKQASDRLVEAVARAVLNRPLTDADKPSLSIVHNAGTGLNILLRVDGRAYMLSPGVVSDISTMIIAGIPV